MNMELFFEIHKDLPREGPGSDNSTRKAFQSIEGLPDNPAILDLGCGPGKQTLELMRLTNGQVVAVDFHAPYLDRLFMDAAKEGFAGRYAIFNADMADLPLPENSFDLIWSEGAIYIIGFENGLRYWKKFLNPGGYIAVTEITWLKENPSQELSDFWNTYYPGMQTIDKNKLAIKNAGLSPVHHFVLPYSDWMDNYYTPLKRRIQMLEEKYSGNREMEKLLESEKYEIALFEKYSEYYGYVFYIMKL